MDGNLGEHLAVEGDAGFLEAIHKLGVVHVIELAAGGDPGDPQAAERSLFLFSADERVAPGLHYRFFRGAEQLASSKEISFCELLNFLSSFMGHDPAFNTSHL